MKDKTITNINFYGDHSATIISMPFSFIYKKTLYNAILEVSQDEIGEIKSYEIKNIVAINPKKEVTKELEEEFNSDDFIEEIASEFNKYC